MNFNLLQIKHQNNGSKNQMLIFNKDLRLIDSCNSIFVVNEKEDLINRIPFLESVFRCIEKKDINLPIVYQRVEAPATFLKGIYDFEFSNDSLNGKNVILLIIHDLSAQYFEERAEQQMFNEKEIQKQKSEGELRNKDDF